MKEIIQNILQQQVALIETFLYEFCEVHGIDEVQLKDNAYVVSDSQNSTIGVVNMHTKNIEFGVKPITVGENTQLFIFGEYIAQMGRYPKTTSLINS